MEPVDPRDAELQKMDAWLHDLDADDADQGLWDRLVEWLYAIVRKVRV